MNVDNVKSKLRKLGTKQRAEVNRSFFKTGPGEYGEGDIFVGVRVPDIRKLVKECKDATLPQATRLLRSKIHEERLLALLILVRLYAKADEPGKKKIYEAYLKNTRYINNWDLVDLSAEHIVGAYLFDRSKRPLDTLAKSTDLWERRIAILATFHCIKRGEFDETLRIAEKLLDDEHDLIHKAVGWMLREVGKRHQPTEERFLKKHYKKMSRTMLRYAIERFPETKRQEYLKGKV